MSRRPLLALALMSGLALAGCAPADQEATTSGTATGSASAADCTPDKMQTHEPGKLTVATDDPAYEPWFADNDPSNGKGYESAVAYAIAEELGYTKDQVVWKRVPFNAVVNPGEHPFDFDLNQVSITEERRNAVDFSSGYYDVRQTVVTTKGSAIADVTTVAQLREAKLGAQVGTTSLTAIDSQIKPTSQPAVFDTNDAAVQALKNGQVDGIVVDLPTAFYMTAAQLDDGTIIGQLPAGDAAEQFGAVLPKGSPVTGCVSSAVDTLKQNGTLDRLEKEHLTSAGAPELAAGDSSDTSAN